ncbi:MAG: sigma-54-dependent transcriptional regulator [Alkalispirochaeta sp.]
MTGTILVVDDNEKVFESLKPNFRHFGLNAIHAPGGTEAQRQVVGGNADIVLLDIRLGNENGIDVLREIKEIAPSLPVIMITGFGSIDTAVEAMKLGAFDYVKKPLDFDRLFKVVENALELSKLSEENAVLRRRIQELSPQICMENGRMYEIVDQARKLAQTDIPVLITGDNGSGKEVIADYIHTHSDRAGRKMHKINCAAFPESLLDNELFGHEKGAYTGANATFQGIFERADKSTLFLDEIGDMPLTIQAKILRVLQNREVRRIGGTDTISINVRFVAATNQNLPEKIASGEFREDLFFRLNTAILTVPPLRERREDIPHLTEYFLSEFSSAHGKPVTAVSGEVMDLFFRYPWPGNVRELKNAINYGVAITSDSTIGIEDLPPSVLAEQTTTGAAAVPQPRGKKEESERELISRTLADCRWNKKRTAEILGISRKTLYAKIERYGIGA